MEALHEYPRVPVLDFGGDFEASRAFGGRGVEIVSVNEVYLNSGEKLVYLIRQKESDEMVHIKNGEYGRKVILDSVVCGYKVNPSGIFKGLKDPKIKLVPKSKRDGIKKELANRLKSSDVITSYFFWD